MTIREKLVYLCDTNNGWVDEVPAEEFADYLIENGVTIPTHGKWIYEDDYVTTAYGSLPVYRCSSCRKKITIDEFDSFCPNCGAIMDLED